MDTDFGFNLHFYGTRLHDAALGRFTTIDRIADNFAFVSPYNYAENRVPNGIDLHGLQIVLFHQLQNAGRDKVLSTNDVSNRMVNAFETTSGQEASLLRKASIYASNYIDEFGGFLEANDGAVLLEGQNLDGTTATTTDKILAGIGIFIPIISGSGIAKGVRELISTELGMQNIDKIDNIAEDLKSATGQKEFEEIFLGTEGPAKIIDINGQTFILDGHHRLQAAEKANTGFSVPVENVELPFGLFKTKQDVIDASEFDIFNN